METLLYTLSLLRPVFEVLVYPALVAAAVAYFQKASAQRIQANTDTKATANQRVASMAFRTGAEILFDLQQRGLRVGTDEWKVAFALAVGDKARVVVNELVTPLASLEGVGEPQVKDMIERQAKVIMTAGMSAVNVATGQVK